MTINSLLNTIGLFMHFAGFIIGLGAVTVIDIHGFLGRKSTYWTEATTRTHKVTKPLIWVGIILASIGGMVVYRSEHNSIIPIIQAIIALALLLNGYFLSYIVSPFLLARERAGQSTDLLPLSWQKKIMISLIISDLGWWGSFTLSIYYVATKI